ncbi:MAG: 2-oxo-tetronate isomerase [Geminicoccaceae bacterium]
MPQFAANLSMMFTEYSFLDRFQAAADAGFEAVEYLFPYDFKPADLAERLEQTGLKQVLFNLPPGDWDAGERGLACLPDRVDEFVHDLDEALAYAHALECPRLHMMAGIAPVGFDRTHCIETYRDNLKRAADGAARHDRTVLIEPINARDMKGYFLNKFSEAIQHLDAVDRDNAKLQLDLYHCQIIRGDLAETVRALLRRTDHIQIAGVPGRHEPDIGEINYPYLFRLLDELNYQGWVGCEYRPEAGTLEGLGWLREATRVDDAPEIAEQDI